MKSGLFRIVCPHCKKESLENNEKFDPSRKPTGAMFQQVEEIQVRSKHDAMEHVKGQNFQCPMCVKPIVIGISGLVRLRDLQTDEIVLSKDAVESKPKKSKPVNPYLGLSVERLEELIVAENNKLQALETEALIIQNEINSTGE